MKKLIVNGVIGVLLFGGSLVGGLAATGRLNHEGVANIPVLSSFFPPPPDGHGEEAGEDGAHAEDQPGAAPHGEVAEGSHSGEPGTAEAGHEGGEAPGPQGPRPVKTGKSVLNPEPEGGDDGHGGGHGGGHGADDGHGDDAHGEEDGHKKAEGTHTPAPARAPSGHGADSAERDFSAREIALAQEQTNRYAPGGFFNFQGMPAGISPEQLNEAWERVQLELEDLGKRKTALDLREKELQELADDVSRRHLELGRMREDIVSAQRRLDERIRKFQDQVKLVRNDEVEALRRNAKTLESFEAQKAAELIQQQWKTDDGQTEVLKTFEFMQKDKVNEIIQMLDNALIRDVLKKRLLVSKESAPTGK